MLIWQLHSFFYDCLDNNADCYLCYLFAQRHGYLVTALAGVLDHEVVEGPQPGRDLVPGVGLLGVLTLALAGGGAPATPCPRKSF